MKISNLHFSLLKWFCKTCEAEKVLI